MMLLAFALSLSACTVLSRQTAGPEEDAVEPVQGGQVVVVIPEEPATLNEYLDGSAIVRQVADATLAGLSTIDPNGDFQPLLAEAIPSLAAGTVSQDFLTVTWKLRPGLKWSDGAPITADDVQFTWETVSDPESGAQFTNGFDAIASIETPDDLTAVVRYRQVNRVYPAQFAYGLLPRHAAGAPNEMEQWAWNRRPVGAGPFVVSTWIAGDRIVMERNPNYYRAGQPYLDRLIFVVTPESGAQMAMMRQGQADVHLWPRATKADYDRQAGGRATLQTAPGRWTMALHFNLSKPFDDDGGPTPPHPILGDRRVRRALAYAIDYDTIVNQVNPGVTPATTPFASGWYGCDIPRTYAYNVDKANSLLDAAGWVMGDDGVRLAQGAPNAADGARLRLQMEGYRGFQPLIKLEEAIVQMWKSVGVETTVQNDDFSVIFGSLANDSPRKTGNFDVLIYDARLPIDPQATVANSFSSTAIPSADDPAGANYSRWVNADADAAIEKAGSTVDAAIRRSAYCDLARLIDAELPQLTLYVFDEGYGVSNRLRGNVVNVWGSLTWDVQNWWLKR